MIKNLGGWQRIAIALSALWLVAVAGVALWEWQAPFYEKSVFFDIVPQPQQPLSPSDQIPVDTPFKAQLFATILVIPVFALWVGGFVLLKISRWVSDGFKA